MADLNTLHGDGINFQFFDLLWSKNSNDKDDVRKARPFDNSRKNKRQIFKRVSAKPNPILRVPDTVMFLFG